MAPSFTVYRTGKIWYRVESERATDVYLVDEDGLEQYRSGRAKFEYYVGRARRCAHAESVRLPPGTYHLLIINDGEEDAPIWFEVG
ncbi:MAG: hypothetical protein HY719_08435 [Planctomycetes bacterium]|nr:hypothetical protein [Planctomycetota bacterium]